MPILKTGPLTLIFVFQLNRATSWIDGSFVYSTSEAWAAALRSYRNGSLRTEPGSRMPVRNTMRVPLFNSPAPHVLRTGSPERLFLLGDPRTNQNPALLSFGILFHRWHNVLAARVQKQHPDWPDEEVFERARRLVIACMQVTHCPLPIPHARSIGTSGSLGRC